MRHILSECAANLTYHTRLREEERERENMEEEKKPFWGLLSGGGKIMFSPTPLFRFVRKESGIKLYAGKSGAFKKARWHNHGRQKALRGEGLLILCNIINRAGDGFI